LDLSREAAQIQVPLEPATPAKARFGVAEREPDFGLIPTVDRL